ncbi:MAG: DegQ family serine endoprotease [Desulfobacterales bacterium]|nr:DegQ family serine endoprotease [Desulfobacterales bacterium]
MTESPECKKVRRRLTMHFIRGNKKIKRYQKIIFSLLIVAIFLVVPALFWANDTNASTAQISPQSFTKLSEKASSAVVNIRTVKTIESQPGQAFQYFFQGPQGNQQQLREFFEKFFGNLPQQQFQQRSLGSGFIIDTEGYIVTNYHVIKNADQVKVKLKSGKEYSAEIIGSDPPTDLALLKIDSDKKLPELELGNSDKMAIGQWVLAIGNPFGLEHTVTSGIISAKGRVIGAGPYDDFIQTDASINPGNSGGPLLNMKGEVIGINTAILAAGEGIGFAVPSSMAKDIVAQLKESGEVTRGWLGVGIQSLDKDLKAYYDVDHGVLVTRVFKGDPADKAGLKPNDIIISVNGKKVDSARELSNKISNLSVGEKAKIKVYRDGDTKTLTVEIAKRDEAALHGKGAKEDKESANMGIAIANITPQLAEKLNINQDAGVIVVDVKAGSKADKAGIQKNDIITEIKHKSVSSVADCQKIIKNVEEGDKVQFLIKRPRRGLVVVTLTK